MTFPQRVLLLGGLLAPLLIACGRSGGPDTVPPSVVATAPLNGTAQVALGCEVSATFNEPIDPTSADTNFLLTDDVGANVLGQVSVSGRTVRFLPAWPLKAGTEYKARLTTGIRDRAGNPLRNETEWRFTTRNGDAWTSIATRNAPEARFDHTAVWTGKEMIIWGGTTAGNLVLSTGARYDACADRWTRIADAPLALTGHTAVWTGSEMIVWGGSGTLANRGARYNPMTDSWSLLPPAPIEAKTGHTAVWTGTEMIVWGGANSIEATSTGARYDPAANRWTRTTDTDPDVPVQRANHTAVWARSEMIIWGGRSNLTTLDNGGIYDPVNDQWSPLNSAVGITNRANHTAVWSESSSSMLVWGGTDDSGTPLNNGGRYTGFLATWSRIDPPAFSFAARHGHTAVWTGTEMIVWGGTDGAQRLNDGAAYNPGTGAWRATATPSLTGRTGHTAVSAGGEMIVWGGRDAGGIALSDGAAYIPD